MKSFSQALFVSLGLAAAGMAHAAEKQAPANAPASNAAPDNSGVNQSNNGATGISADQQSNAKSDIDITQKIRRSITSEKGISTYGQNIKILTQSGAVVLKGPVRSAEEKTLIESKAGVVAGKENVKSELQVVPR